MKIKANKCVLFVVFIRKGERGNEKSLKCELNRECRELLCSCFLLCKILLSLALLSKEKTICVTKKRNILKVCNLLCNGRACYGEKLQQYDMIEFPIS